jgi:hypothetical protein
MMERDNQSPASLIELGTASVETQGPGGFFIEREGYWIHSGLSDD